MNFSWHFWVGFHLFVVAMLGLDLGLFRRRKSKTTETSLVPALLWSFLWIGLALSFAGFLWQGFGKQAALEFVTAYLLEKSLSVDNLFVFVMIFSFFKIRPTDQHRVLVWGVLGALVMRAGFILGGIKLFHAFHQVTYLFGAILIFSSYKMAFKSSSSKEQGGGLADKAWVQKLRSFFPRKKGQADDSSKLILALIVVELTDVLFALDSIPAALAVSSSSFLVYTSNVFAILGLRSLYFVLSGFLESFAYLHYGLAAILCLVGVKMAIQHFYIISTGFTLVGIFTCLACSVGASLFYGPKKSG